MADRPISEAFYLATQALADKCGTPLPKGLSQAEIGDWKLAINASDEPVEFDGRELPPYEVFAENTVYIGFAMFGPYGGGIGGMSEDRFIADMNAAGYTA